MVTCREDKIFHFNCFLHFLEPETNGRRLCRFPPEGNACFGSIKKMANDRFFFFLDFPWNIGGVKKKESWVIREWTLCKFLGNEANFFPQLFKLRAIPKDMEKYSLFLLASPTMI